MNMNKINIKGTLEEFYLDYVNNYLTYAQMAEDYNMSVNDVSQLVDIGRVINNKSYDSMEEIPF